MDEQNMFYIKILSPVHIGCDEVYEPAGFIVDEQAGTLIAFDPLDFFRSLDAKTKENYSSICGRGNIESILELYKFMKGKHFTGHAVDVCRGLMAQYQKTLRIPLGDRRKIQQELNNFSISRTAFNPITQKPYLPGSALKGAFRTAYLNHLAKNMTVTVVDRRDKNPANALEKALLEYQSLEKDPFRLMKISDFHPVGPYRTKIIYAVNAKKIPSKFPARGPFQILEVIQPGAVFAGSIQVLEPLARDAIKTPLSAEKVFEGARVFYTKEKKREDIELKAADLPISQIDGDGGICPLRIGRHSGAESLTVEGHRHIKIMKKRGEKPAYSDKAITFWLASETPDSKTSNRLEPFGWVSLGPMTQTLKDELEARAAEQENIKESYDSKNVSKPDTVEKSVAPVKDIEEIWSDATVSYDAGGAGKIVAQGKTQAVLQGTGNRDNLKNAVTEALHKNVFEKKKPVKARVTVRKAGNSWEIVKVEPAA